MVDGSPSRRSRRLNDGSGSLALATPDRADPADRVERIPLGLRWINDACEVAPSAGGFAMNLVDMTQAKLARRILREADVPATITHLIVRACALALARNPHLHQTVCATSASPRAPSTSGSRRPGRRRTRPWWCFPR